jgi:hypothetical protein
MSIKELRQKAKMLKNRMEHDRKMTIKKYYETHNYHNIENI